jgi:GT2 family glycosyltransferase
MYPDVPGNPKALREHYLQHGWREGRWPHPLFDPAFYLAANPDVAGAGVEPLAHYESMGWREGRDPNPLFSVAWYLERNPDIAALGIEPVGHYARDGWRDGRQPHPLFDVAMVRATDPELSAQGAPSTDPLAAYLHGGWTRGARACDLFDEAFYRSQAQALPADADALTHYAGLGWRHGYDPAPWFVGEEIARTVPGSGLVERLGFVLSTDPELLETLREPAGADLGYTPDLRTAYQHKGGRWSIEARTYAAHHGPALSRIVRVGRAIEFPWLAPLGSRMTLTVRGVPAGHAADAAPVRVRATLIPLSGADASRGSEAGAAIDLGIASLRCGELRWSLMHLDAPVAPGRRYRVRLEGVADPGVPLAAGVSVFGWMCDTRRFPVVPHLEGRDGGIGLAERLLERKSMGERTARVAVLGPVGPSSIARTAAAAAWARDRFAGAAVEATVLDDAERALRFAENADVVILADDGHVPRHAADADALPEALQGLGACTVKLRLDAPDRSSLALLDGAAKRPLATETQTDRRCHFAVEVTRDGAERWSASTPGGEMLLDRVGADLCTDGSTDGGAGGDTDRETITPAALHDAAWGTALPRVVIVTVLYRKSAVVERFLGAIDRQTYAGPLSVVMVDDRSPDDDAAKARAYWEAHDEGRRGGRSLEILVNEENTGNCGSRNRGIAETDGDIYIVIDCDCLLNDGFVEAHVREHLLGNAEVVCGPLNIEAGDRDPEQVVRDLDGDRDAILEAANPQDALVANGFVNCITRNVSIAAKYAKQGDLFDEAFAYSAKPGSGFGWEDVEMGASLYKQGARIVFIDDAYSVHCTHPASGDEAALCRGSARNFVRLSEKHPDLPLIARRWMSETAGKIDAWARSCGAVDSGNTADFETLRETYARGRAISAPHLAMRERLASLGRPLRVLTYRWHAPHQYELYKLPCEFTLATGLGTGMVDVWSYDQRPLRDNARLMPMDRVDPSEFDCAILHFDENILSVDSTNGVIGHDWGSAFRAALEWDIPKVAICHGTPQFEGQYGLLRSPLASFAVYESERRQLVEALRDVPVVCNSWQALDEWGFEDARVIWHGFDPQEFAPGTYERAVLTHGADPNRPHYRGESVYNEVLARLEGVRIDTARHPGAPILRRTTNAYAVRNFRSYVDHIRKYTAYLNTTLRSPMPRSRGEAMMCGVIPVCLRNHDVEHFIRHGVNGFVGDSAPELASYIEHLLAHPADARRIGESARRTAMDVFNNDRFLAEWCDLLGAITGIGDGGPVHPGGHG